MKYENMELSEDELNDICIIKCSNESKCSICGELTKYIDYCTESYICSEDCMNIQNEKLVEYLKGDKI